MKLIKLLIMFVIVLGSSFAFASNVPTVSQVETTIASGNYLEARKQLGEVLKENPDSYVANRYMFEIIKIENGRDNVSSVEYKIYEDKIKHIEATTAKRVADETKAKQKAIKEERTKSVLNALLFSFFFICFIAICVFGFLFYRKKSEAKKAEQERLRFLQEKENHFNAWKNRANQDLVDLSYALERASIKPASSQMDKELVGDYTEDNIDIIERIKERNVNQSKVDKHIFECKQFLNKNFGENL